MRSESSSSSPERPRSRLLTEVVLIAAAATLATALVYQLDLAGRFQRRARDLEGFGIDQLPFVAIVIMLAAIVAMHRSLVHARRENRRRQETELLLHTAETREHLVLTHVATLVFEWTSFPDRDELRYLHPDFPEWRTRIMPPGGTPTQLLPDSVRDVDRERVYAYLEGTLGAPSEERHPAIEYRLAGASSQWRSLEVVVVERDPDGVALHVIGVETDVTSRMQLERQRSGAEAAEARSDVARGIVHDLGNLLMALDVYTQQLDPSDEAVRGVISVRERARGLVSALGELGRASPRPPVLIDVGDIAASSVEAMRTALPGGTRITLALGGGDAQALGSEQAMDRILQNLIQNAQHAIEPDAGRIEVKVSALPGELPKLRLAVSDNGCGMDSDELAMAREVFYTTKKAGSGLGLSVVEHLVREMSGELHIESKPGEGTTVMIDLPAAPASEATPAQGPAS